MAGVQFSYENFKELVRLNIGIAKRLDENRAESLTILYCDFLDFSKDDIKASFVDILRDSDSIVNFVKDYYFVLPYTDKYGAGVVKKVFDEFFGRSINHFIISYPVDGETPEELFEFLQNGTKTFCKKDLSYLDSLYTLAENAQ